MDTEATLSESLAGMLQTGLGAGVKVTSTADGTTPEVTKPLVMLVLKSVKPGITVAHTRSVEYEAICAIAQVTPGVAAPLIETFVGEVLDVVDAIDWCTWTDAERSVYLPEPEAAGFPAFTITLQVEVK